MATAPGLFTPLGGGLLFCAGQCFCRSVVYLGMLGDYVGQTIRIEVWPFHPFVRYLRPINLTYILIFYLFTYKLLCV